MCIVQVVQCVLGVLLCTICTLTIYLQTDHDGSFVSRLLVALNHQSELRQSNNIDQLQTRQELCYCQGKTSVGVCGGIFLHHRIEKQGADDVGILLGAMGKFVLPRSPRRSIFDKKTKSNSPPPKKKKKKKKKFKPPPPPAFDGPCLSTIKVFFNLNLKKTSKQSVDSVITELIYFQHHCDIPTAYGVNNVVRPWMLYFRLPLVIFADGSPAQNASSEV